MNVLKSSGGHISGMSNHNHNLVGNDRQHHYRGVTGSGASGPNYPHQYKPLSSPRSSQQHNGHNNAKDNLLPSTQNDPNFIYQQQLQHKSPGGLAGEVPEKQSSEPGTI